METKSICVVIPTYNRGIDLQKQLTGLSKQTIIPDIVIVDNASTDNTFKSISKEYKLRDPTSIKNGRLYKGILIGKNKKSKINYLLENENTGCAEGYYIGQEYAYKKGYECIILSDSDIVPISNNLIEQLVKNVDPNTTSYGTDISLLHHWNGNIKERYHKLHEDHAEYHYWAFPRNIIGEIGYPIKKFFFYYDDIEYSERVNKKFNIKELRTALYSHHGTTLTNFFTRVVTNSSYYIIRNKLMFAIHYSGDISRAFKIAINDFEYSFFIMLLTFKMLKFREALRYNMYISYGILDGLMGNGGRSKFKDQMNLVLLKYNKYPKDAVYLTLIEKKVTKQTKDPKNFKKYEIIDVSDGLKLSTLFNILFKNKQVIANDSIAEAVHARCLPLATFKEFYIYKDDGLFKLCSTKIK